MSPFPKFRKGAIPRSTTTRTPKPMIERRYTPEEAQALAEAKAQFDANEAKNKTRGVFTNISPRES